MKMEFLGRVFRVESSRSIGCGVLSIAATAPIFMGASVLAQDPVSAIEQVDKIGGVKVEEVLKLLGAKMESGLTLDQLEDYKRHFALVDGDKDGKHSKAEFIEKGTYMTPQARRGIFMAADANADGVVTREEYVLNRIITDEAKSIVQAMDDDKDRVVKREEFIKNAFSDGKNEELAKLVFEKLDTNEDGGIVIPEYLRVWGKWARTGRESAQIRVSAWEEKAAGDGKVPDHTRQYREAKHLLDGTSFQYFYEDGSGLEISFDSGKVKYEWIVGPRKGNRGENIRYQSRSIGEEMYLVNWHEEKKPDFTSLVIDLKKKSLYSTAILRYGTGAEMIHFKEARIEKVKRPSK